MTPGDSTVGYCLYRTKTPGKGKDCPKNSRCEQVNPVAVLNTRCVDDLVEDNTTYYYVAIAINSASKTSTSSEEAIAEVPIAGKHNPPPPDADSYTDCRSPGSQAQSPGH